MPRSIYLAAVVILAGSVQCRGPLPPPTAPSALTALDEAAQSDHVVMRLYQEGKFQEALPVAERSLALREKALGAMHPDLVNSLNNLAALYRALSAYDKAAPLLVRALDIQEKSLGPMHPNVAASLNNLAALYEAQGEYGKAEPLYVRVLGIREKVLGPMHPDVAQSLNDLGTLYREQGAYGKAEPLLIRALDIREKALGPLHPDVAQSLSNLAGLYEAQGTYGRAEPLLVRALDIREKVLGPLHPDVAQSLSNLAGLYEAQGAYGRAEPLLVRALDIREKALGPAHPDVTQSLNNLAGLYEARGAYGRAESLYARALDISEKTLGPLHPGVAASLNNLGTLYREQGAYGKAEPVLVRALDISEKALGPTHPSVAQSLNNLAALYEAQGAYGRAEPLYARALDISEKTLGPLHSEVAASLNNLALVYQDQGAYGKAEPLLVRALDIREKVLGANHPDVATSLNNLATLYEAQGAYGKAEPILLRALDIREKASGPTHPSVAASLNNLAALYGVQGAYGKAEPLLVRALDIREKASGPTHPDVVTSLNNLALLYTDQRAYNKAEPLLVRALDIREKALGSTHPDVVTSLNNLAAFYETQGSYGKAEPLLVRALDIREKTLGSTHPDVATSLNNLALLYTDQRAYGKAEPLLVRALDIREKAVGPTHPAIAKSLSNLAMLYQAQGSYERAEPLLSRAAEIWEEQLHVGDVGDERLYVDGRQPHVGDGQRDLVGRGMRVEVDRSSSPEPRILRMPLLQGETERLVSLHVHTMPGSNRALETALTAVLRRKGRILDLLIDDEATWRSRLAPPLRDKLDQLTRARAEFVVRLHQPMRLPGATDRTALASVHAHIDDLESALSSASAEFRVQSEPVTMAKVQAALPRDSALVEFVRYCRFDVRLAQPWQEERYVAYLLIPNGPPQWVALGAAAPIEAEVDSVLATMHGDASLRTTKAALQRLDALVLAPIRARLPDRRHLILAPDGELNLVPFEALVDPQGHYMLDQYLVSYVTTGRDLLHFTIPHRSRSSAVIMAGPDYGPMPQPGKSATAWFAPLARARAEATALQRYFPTPPVTGEKATKSALAALTGPAMLHMATYGFYARDANARSTPPVPTASVPPASAAPASSAILAQHNRAPSVTVFDGDSWLLPPPRYLDPADGLDRAGLAMAGANRGADGIVTAREIARFDWWGTQLVVLSACETRAGAVRPSDGVYSLRRALVLSGAESQVVSLWSPSDSSARELMAEYYGELMRGVGRAEALRQAKLRLMRQTGYGHPYYWAPFIPIGDWRPLDKNTIPHQGGGQ